MSSDRPRGDLERRAGAQQCPRAVERRRGGVRAQWPLSRRWQAACRQLHLDRACQARGRRAWNCTKACSAAPPTAYSTARSSSTKMPRSPTRARPTRIYYCRTDAVVNTKPQLEIHADDVKCSHGSTIGQLDADAMFYLRSRGLDVATARSLVEFCLCQRRGAADENRPLAPASGRVLGRAIRSVVKLL